MRIKIFIITYFIVINNLNRKDIETIWAFFNFTKKRRYLIFEKIII